ncbi:DUF2779 domain-containing protein [Kaistella jeonii]|uniref:DUF2779 domain-containing protein n=1 Tax=Kaistella jeonii TaxID=266749 RepID=A0A0C1F8W5_9FLAO|nr:DUF2779 domain-containing protein [Kaistella jeonii]KIA89572.1 hypothetical protein OA86_02750 [Kaistella jeonii]SFB90759.1 protein of unknown function [Kaistella jeonii]VEI95777.1 Domain of uncharacterised function(DUF2779) [Kaistella jeonii]
MKSISKSRFVSGVQCSKKIYFEYFRKDLKLPVSEATQQIFDLGHTVGSLAQNCFPNGEDATPEDFSDFSTSIQQTTKWIAEKKKTIYEATFATENTLVMLDILHRNDDEIWAIEVKSSTSVKEYHYTDAAFQYYVMSKSGCVPDQFFLMHINNQYVKNGAISSEFFHLENITDEVIEMQDWVELNFENLLQVLNSKQEPVIEIGAHCSDPFECEFAHHCWKHVPENSVFGLTRAGKKSWQLYNDGILKLADIPEDYNLTFAQQLQVNGIKNNESYKDFPAIREFLNSWEEPLHFFDFETIFAAIPVLDGTKPYQQIPFQYSLHILEGEKAISHKEFLANPKDFTNGQTDPRKKMIDQMKLDFLDKGSIVTYNQSFEVGRLKELAKDFPEDAAFLFGLIDRIVDLLVVFNKRWYYLPAMGNSASIKSVLPAIAPEFSYDDLEISDGGSASTLFHESILDETQNTEQLRQNLLKYCERDTYGMVVIYEFLRNELDKF